ncbi:MAG: rod shape-determining protein MreC [Ruminococcaceae bacterium]|nr:rod shape-determining protein MreC [Oscillospiraceae bacterium]
MKQFFKNKFFYIISVITLLVTIVPTVFYSMGIGFVFRDMVGTALTPMQKVFNYGAEAIDGFISYFYKFDEIVDENVALKERVSELEAQIYDAKELEDAYAWLSEFLDLKVKHTDFEMMPASVTGRESGNYASVLTLDVGSGVGIKRNMPVVTSIGIVGRVTEVGYNWCKVTTIVEAQSSVGAFLERTDEAGVVEGKFELSADGLCEMNYLPVTADVKVDDRVLSSGYGSVYPRGLVIGYVDEIGVNEYTRGLNVKVRCAVDFSDLTDVMIITNYDLYAEGEESPGVGRN